MQVALPIGGASAPAESAPSVGRDCRAWAANSADAERSCVKRKLPAARASWSCSFSMSVATVNDSASTAAVCSTRSFDVAQPILPVQCCTRPPRDNTSSKRPLPSPSTTALSLHPTRGGRLSSPQPREHNVVQNLNAFPERRIPVP